jgi:hypothetical protein
VFPDVAAAPAESARLHALAAKSQAATGREAAALDEQLARLLTALLAPGSGERLATVFATAPSAAVHRHLWRLLAQCERNRAAGEALGVTVFAMPVVIVAGIEGERRSPITLTGVLDDAAALAAILREHGALAGNQAFALANVVVAASAIDFARLPDLLAWRALSETPPLARALEPAPITLAEGVATVHLRFLVGSALAETDLLGDGRVGKWGIPFTQALGRQLAAPDASVLALPRAPQSLLNALQQGRAAHREVGAHVFVSNAIRKLRAAVGEPTAIISTHRTGAASGGGEVRLSLSSPFGPNAAEGFRCPLFPLDRVGDVVAMLKHLLDECRVADVRIVAGVHGDRNPDTGLPLLFKGDDAPSAATH